MTLSLLTTPDKLINGIQSNVNAGRSQLPYTFQRKDVLSYYVGTLGGFAEIYLDDIPDALLFTIGDTVYFGYDIYSERILAGFYTVLGVNTGAGRIQLDAPYTSAGGGQVGWLNNITTHENYKVNIEIANGANTALLIKRTFKYSPKPDGSLFIDIAEIVTEYQEQNLLASLEYMVIWFESWTGTTGTKSISDVIQSIYGMKQMFQLGGSNLWEHLLNLYQEQTGFGINFGDNANHKVNIALNDSSIFIIGDWVRVISESGQDIIGQVFQIDKPDTNPPNIQIESPTLETYYDISPNRVFTATGKAKFLTKFASSPADSWIVDTPLIYFSDWQNYAVGGSTWNSGGNPFTSLIPTGENPVGSDILGINVSQVPIIPETTTISLEITLQIPQAVVTNGAVGRQIWGFDGSIWVQGAGGFIGVTGTTVVTTIDWIVPGGTTLTLIGIRIGQRTGTDQQITVLDIKVLSALPNRSTTINALSPNDTNPLMWRGWKRTVSYLMDENFGVRTALGATRMSSVACNINKSGIAGVNKEPNNDITPRIISELIDNPNAVNQEFIRVTIRDTSLSTNISEAIFYKVLEQCDNPIMIQYLNSLGAFEQHLFTINQQFQIEVEQGLTGERAINKDYEQTNRTKIRVPLRWTQQMIVTAEQLTFDQMNALRELKESGLVSVFLTKDGSKQIYVVINNMYQTDYDTENALFNISFQLEFPDNFDFFKAKEY